jgi:hypothetical protein
MFQHLLFLLSESVTLPAPLCLCLGMLVYFTLHNWQKVGALSRNRSQLLSVGVVLAVVLLILQLSPSGRDTAGVPRATISLLSPTLPRRGGA